MSAPGQRTVTYETHGHRYVFLWPAGSADLIVDAVSGLAGDPEHPLTWIEAAMIAYRIGAEQARELDVVVDKLLEDITGEPSEPD